jgi:hypothetical protein
MDNAELISSKSRDPSKVAELLDVISQATDTYERSFADERMRLAHTVRGKAI